MTRILEATKGIIFRPVFLFLLTSGGFILIALKCAKLVSWSWFFVLMPCGVCFALLWIEHIHMRLILKRSIKEVETSELWKRSSQ